MGTYSLDEIMKRWQMGKITAEQAIGQILQLIQNLSQRVGQLEKRADRQRRDNGPNAN
ncbi:MAG: hypothetical protein GY803_21120 [Chloroflexi bacterium]|nr:hypothetical protein [Chloroflexota bacterium]